MTCIATPLAASPLILQCLEDQRVLDYMESVNRVSSLDSTPDVNASDLILETIPRALSQKEVLILQLFSVIEIVTTTSRSYETYL